MERDTKKKTFVVDAPEKSGAQEADKISFNSWFTFKVAQRRKVQAHHYDAIQAFFKKQGLSELETPKAFDSALKAFGY